MAGAAAPAASFGFAPAFAPSSARRFAGCWAGLAGEGEAGLRGGAPGDLYIFLAVKPHRFFQRDGANIHCRVPISMPTAALGGAVEVPSVDGGRAKVSVAAGTQSGHQFRLRGKG